MNKLIFFSNKKNNWKNLSYPLFEVCLCSYRVISGVYHHRNGHCFSHSTLMVTSAVYSFQGFSSPSKKSKNLLRLYFFSTIWALQGTVKTLVAKPCVKIQRTRPIVFAGYKSTSAPVATPLVGVRLRLDNLGPQPGSRKRAKRKGRGISAGQGASCGFGMRGQKSRSGPGVRKGFEGGQMPLYRRIPKLRGIAGGNAPN